MHDEDKRRCGEEMTEDEEVSSNQLQGRAYECFKARVLTWANNFDDNVDNSAWAQEINDDGPLIFNYHQIKAQKSANGIHTISTHKKYNPVLVNAVITNNNFIIPFGYNGDLY